MEWKDTLAYFSACLPKPVSRLLARLPEGATRELRVRAGQRVRVITCDGELDCDFAPAPQQVEQMAEALCEHALYARAEEQRQGFVTLRGGHRMGLCGRVILQGQSVRALREVSSLCVRVAGQWRGAADELLPYLTDENGRVQSALILGMPGMGKTTMLREACRALSEGGARVGLVDERGELAAMCGGLPQLDVGPNTDVLDGCPKDAGMRWLLRAMSPQVLATDELGGPMDAQAVMDMARCGIKTLCTLHGRDLDMAVSRGALYLLAQNRVFDRYAVLSEREVGKLAGVYDAQLRPIGPGGEA